MTSIGVPSFMLVSRSAQFTQNFELNFFMFNLKLIYFHNMSAGECIDTVKGTYASIIPWLEQEKRKNSVLTDKLSNDLYKKFCFSCEEISTLVLCNTKWNQQSKPK